MHLEGETRQTSLQPFRGATATTLRANILTGANPFNIGPQDTPTGRSRPKAELWYPPSNA
jgi:hypothetical protein